MLCLHRPSAKCARHLHFNGINCKTTNITLEASSNATMPINSGRAKTHGQHARAAEVLTNTEIAFPRKAATSKKCARRRGWERQFWVCAHLQWNNALSKIYTFMQFIEIWILGNRLRFFNTPSKIHASDLRRAEIKAAKRYAHGNEGGATKRRRSNKKMQTATKARITELTFSTPPTREAHFAGSTTVADETKSNAAAWVAETLRCKTACTRKVLK